MQSYSLRGSVCVVFLNLVHPGYCERIRFTQSCRCRHCVYCFWHPPIFQMYFPSFFSLTLFNLNSNDQNCCHSQNKIILLSTCVLYFSIHNIFSLFLDFALCLKRSSHLHNLSATDCQTFAPDHTHPFTLFLLYARSDIETFY